MATAARVDLDTASNTASTVPAVSTESPQIQSLRAQIEQINLQIINAQGSPNQDKKLIRNLKGRVRDLKEELTQTLTKEYTEQRANSEETIHRLRETTADLSERLNTNAERLTEETERLALEKEKNAILQKDKEEAMKTIRKKNEKIAEFEERNHTPYTENETENRERGTEDHENETQPQASWPRRHPIASAGIGGVIAGGIAYAAFVHGPDIVAAARRVVRVAMRAFFSAPLWVQGSVVGLGAALIVGASIWAYLSYSGGDPQPNENNPQPNGNSPQPNGNNP